MLERAPALPELQVQFVNRSAVLLTIQSKGSFSITEPGGARPLSSGVLNWVVEGSDASTLAVPAGAKRVVQPRFPPKSESLLLLLDRGAELGLFAEEAGGRRFASDPVPFNSRSLESLTIDVVLGRVSELQALAVYIRPGGSESGNPPLEFTLIGETGGQRSIERALDTGDDFLILGSFADPVYWYLLWIGPGGDVTLLERSRGAQATVRFPSEEGTVATAKGRGVHMALLLSASRELSEADLLRAFDGLGPPPNSIPEKRGLVFRGVDAGRGPGIRLPEEFLRRVQERLPSDCDYGYGFFLEQS